MSYGPQTIFVKITLLKLYVLNVYIYIYIYMYYFCLQFKNKCIPSKQERIVIVRLYI